MASNILYSTRKYIFYFVKPYVLSVIVAVSCHGRESYHQLQGLSKNGRRISIENKAANRRKYVKKKDRPPMWNGKKSKKKKLSKRNEITHFFSTTPKRSNVWPCLFQIIEGRNPMRWGLSVDTCLRTRYGWVGLSAGSSWTDLIFGHSACIRRGYNFKIRRWDDLFKCGDRTSINPYKIPFLN